jgi:hypothetical protein
VGGVGERPRLRDEAAHERREFLIEAVSWFEDSEGRIGYERARDMVDAHAAEAAEDATARATAAVEALADHYGRQEHWRGQAVANDIRAALDPAPTTDADDRDGGAS